MAQAAARAGSPAEQRQPRQAKGTRNAEGCRISRRTAQEPGKFGERETAQELKVRDLGWVRLACYRCSWHHTESGQLLARRHEAYNAVIESLRQQSRGAALRSRGGAARLRLLVALAGLNPLLGIWVEPADDTVAARARRADAVRGVSHGAMS